MMMFGSAGPGSLAQCVKIDHESRLTDQRQLSILRATALMAELVDAADSKSVFERSGSSSLPRGTIIFLVNQGLREGVERNFYPFFYPKNLPFSNPFPSENAAPSITPRKTKIIH